jgi:hypothetical protein
MSRDFESTVLGALACIVVMLILLSFGLALIYSKLPEVPKAASPPEIQP